MPKKKTAAQLNREIAETLHGKPKVPQSRAHLFVEGVGHRIRNGYEIHWNWRAYRDDKKIDSGALTGGDLPEFYETWPDYRGVKAIITQMNKIMREWIASGEFRINPPGTRLSPKAAVSLRKSGSDVPIR